MPGFYIDPSGDLAVYDGEWTYFWVDEIQDWYRFKGQCIFETLIETLQ